MSQSSPTLPSWQKSFQQIMEWLEKSLKSPALPGEESLLSQKVVQLTADSRQLDAQSVFIALPGFHAHGLDFIQPETACVAVLTPATELAEVQAKIQQLRQQGHCVLEVTGLAEQLGVLANWFYNAPSQKLEVIGITGTNGKTSTAFYAAQLLASQGTKVALMGTLGCGFLGDLQPSANTTPDGVTVHRLLAQFAAEGAEAVVMEVSSHAIALGRIDSVQFHTLALTQVTRDHLDFHGSEQQYHETKKQLFLNHGRTAKHWVVNAEDSVGQAVIQACQKRSAGEKTPDCLRYAVSVKEVLSGSVDLSCEQLQFLPQGLKGVVKLAGLRQACQVNLLGQFNVENLLCALGIVWVQNDGDAVSLMQKLSHRLLELQPVTGRMQRVVLGACAAAENLPVVVIDYAHTPDGLAQALKAFRQHLPNARLTCVFGCGGDRDRGKRPLMGSVAYRLADQVVVTSDNPRCEPPEQIIAEILQGIEAVENVQVIEDRAAAIEQAIAQARPGEGVLIAGKGHETIQQFCEESLYFSDWEVAVQALQKREVTGAN